MVEGSVAVTVPADGRSSAGWSVRVAAVGRTRAGERVLDGFDLTVAVGEIVAIVGPSGCGATTALRVIAGLERADTGTVSIADGLSTAAVFAHTAVPRFGRVGEAVAIVSRRAGHPDPDARARELCGLLGLSDPEAATHRLARGDRRRVLLARALASEARILLLDDPLDGLQNYERAVLRDRLVEHLRDRRITAVWVTRETSEAAAVADRIAVMVRGRIAASGSPEDLFRHMGDPAVAAVLGPVSTVPGIVEDVTVDVWGQDVPLAEAGPDGHCEVIVRPDQVVLVGPTEPGVDAVVQETRFLSNMRLTQVRAQDGSVVQIEHSVEDRVAPQAPVRIALATSAVTVRPLG